MKNAVEARKNSFEPQYKSAMQDIERAIERGYTSTRLSISTILPEVAKELAKKGFEIKIVISKFEVLTHVNVSWDKAQEGEVGEIIYKDEKNGVTY